MVATSETFELVFDKDGAERLQSADKAAKPEGPSPVRLLRVCLQARECASKPSGSPHTLHL